MTRRGGCPTDKGHGPATARRWWLRGTAGAARPLVIAGLILATGSLGALTWLLAGPLLLVALLRLGETWVGRPRRSGPGGGGALPDQMTSDQKERPSA